MNLTTIDMLIHYLYIQPPSRVVIVSCELREEGHRAGGGMLKGAQSGLTLGQLDHSFTLSLTAPATGYGFILVSLSSIEIISKAAPAMSPAVTKIQQTNLSKLSFSCFPSYAFWSSGP